MRSFMTGILLIAALFVVITGCSQPPVRQPTVSVSAIALSDVSLRTMTVNTTIVIFNPNPVGARLNRLAFDVWYTDGAEHYLGHGEQTAIDVKENGNTTVTVPVTIGNEPALIAVGSLIRNGNITIDVNGSASIDLKVTSWDLPFSQTRVFEAADLGLNTAIPFSGNSINVTEGLDRARGLLNTLTQ